MRAAASLPPLPTAEPGVPDVRSAGRFLSWVAVQQRRRLILGAIWGTGWLVAQALVPYALGRGLQAGVARHSTGALAGWAAALLGLTALIAGFGVLRHRAAVINFVTAWTRVTQLVARHAARLGPLAGQRFSAGEVATMANADGDAIAHVMDVSARLSGAVVSMLLVAVLLLTTAPLLGAVVLVGLPVSVVLVAPLVRPLERRERRARVLLGDASALSADLVLGLRVLRGVGGEDLLVGRFDAASQRVRAAGVRAAMVSSALDGLQVLLPGLYVVMVTWVGASEALSHTIDAGELVTVYGWSAFLVLPVQIFVEAAKRWAGATAAASRIAALLSTSPERLEPAAAAVPRPDGDLHDPVTGVTAPGGQLTAVACDDPHAGSELADRLGGWVGEATLGGLRLDALATSDLRATVVVADREPVLLAGTLRDGLAVPAAGPRPELDEALTAAAAQDAVEALPGGLDGVLTTRGRSLSGGQRQRIALARAVRSGAPVLILDEPTSAVDAHTEARIAAALSTVRAGRTTVLVTSSPPLLDAAAEVLWVRGGQVVARGSHRLLMHQEPSYRAFVTRDLGAVRR